MRVITVFLVFLLTGCFAGSRSIDSGNRLSDERIVQLVVGETTRLDLVELLGPPQAILSEGETATIQSSEGSEKISYKEVSTLFPETAVNESKYTIFYYQETDVSGRALIVILAEAEKITIKRKRLWALIRDEDGMLINYKLRND